MHFNLTLNDDQSHMHYRFLRASDKENSETNKPQLEIKVTVCRLFVLSPSGLTEGEKQR